MKNTRSQKIVLGILSLFLLAFVGIQVFRHFSSQYKTETAYQYTVAETMKITGIALRDEELLEDRVELGIASYTASDGTKVSTGFTIAEIYKNERDAELIKKRRELSSQRELLEKAQDPGSTTYAHTDVLNKQIFSSMGSIIDSVNSGSVSDIEDDADSLLVLMNTKQIATGKTTDFSTQIESLRVEEEYYASQIQEEPTAIKSPKPGYFIRTVDGLEGVVDLKTVNQMSVQQVLDAINTPTTDDPTRIGKLMLDHNWYFAAVVPNEELDKFHLGATVTLDFGVSGVEPVPATITGLNTNEEAGNTAVIFKCDYINETLVNLRVAQAEVSFKSLSGLRVSKSAIRYDGIQKGVYIVRGENMVFRPVEVVYEDIGFVICKAVNQASPDYDSSLQQYDEVIIEGMQLYDGKPIK